MVYIFMIAVKAVFMINVKGDEQATGKTNSQTKHINKRKKFIALDIAPGADEITFNHKILFILFANFLQGLK